MAFPVVEAYASGEDLSGDTTHTLTVPSGMTAGDYMVGLLSINGAAVFTPRAGWTLIGPASAPGLDNTAVIAYRQFDGTANDANNVVDSDAARVQSHITLRVSGASGPPTATSSSGSAANSDPPSHAPGGGAKDYLWVVTRTSETGVPASVAPAGYGSLQTVTGGTSSASSNTAERTLNASSENPGVFTSAAESWVCWTIAIPGVASWGPPTGLTVTPVSETELDLSWDTVPGASGYDVERDSAVIATDVTDTEYSDTGLTTATEYTYRVRSVRA